MSKRTSLALALGLLLVLAGCTGLQQSESVVPTGQQAQDGYDALQSISGTVEYHYVSNETTSSAVVDVVKVPKEQNARQEYRSPARLAGDVTVSNGSMVWLYDESENTVTKMSVGDVNFSETRTTEFVRRVFANVTASSDTAIVANPVLPVGPVGTTSGESGITNADLGGPTKLAVEYLGRKTVAGRETVGVKLTPVSDESEDGLSKYIENVTYWFDAEYFVPLETTTVVAINGEVTRNNRVYRNVTFNTGVSADEFSFEPPANATVTTPPKTRTTTFDTVAGATENVSFDVATLEAPAGYTLDEARVTRVRNHTTVSIAYSNATNEVTVSTRTPSLDSLPDAENVSLGRVTATVTEFGDTTAFQWQCGDRDITVRGDIARETLREIARNTADQCRTG